MGKSIRNYNNFLNVSDAEEFDDIDYDGIVPGKTTLFFNNKYYMVKGADYNYKDFYNLDGKVVTSFNNSIISEHIASKIINLISMDDNTFAHQTLLVSDNNEQYVACEHYTLNKYGDYSVMKMEKIVSKYLKHKGIKITTNNLNQLGYILEAISAQDKINGDILLSRFWNQFALDIFLLNWDRHVNNWALLRNKNLNKYELSPIFDQGSTLMSKLDSGAISLDRVNGSLIKRDKFVGVEDFTSIPKDVLGDEIEKMKVNIYKTSSAIYIGDSRINYYDFIKSTDNKDFFKSIKLLLDKINMEEIFRLIEKELSFSKKYQDFYKLLISLSYNEIILKGLSKNTYYQRWLKENNNKEDVISE